MPDARIRFGHLHMAVLIRFRKRDKNHPNYYLLNESIISGLAKYSFVVRQERL